MYQRMAETLHSVHQPNLYNSCTTSWHYTYDMSFVQLITPMDFLQLIIHIGDYIFDLCHITVSIYTMLLRIPGGLIRKHHCSFKQ